MYFLYAVTKQKICIPEDTSDDKTAVFFILARMESTAVLYFLRKGPKLYFYSLGTIFEENMRVSRGAQLLGSGFPIGASSIPVGTRLSSESLVCYTFCDR